MNEIRVYTDGAAQPNPGHAGIGIVIFDEAGNELHRHSEYIGECTNNTAEYTALLRAMEIVPQYGTKKVTFHSDSELLIRQMNRAYRIKKKHLLELHTQVRTKERVFESTQYVHVPRTNKRLQIADGLSKQSIMSRGS